MRPSDLDQISVASVATLVNQRLSESGRWNLALVQRAEVWDEVRMRHLVDSLLAGYPIGAILLSTVRQGGQELAYGADGVRVPQEAARDSWQVLDGQQRINALFSVFTDQGRYGRFYLNLLMERPEPEPAQSRKRKDRAVPHIRHRPDSADEVLDRSDYIDLSRWASWANDRGKALTADFPSSASAGMAHEIDPNFPAELDREQAELAATNLRRLINAWVKPSVPILRAELESPLDVLEVFTRINLGGVDIAGADVYFAGVKTFWNDAERRIDDVLSDAPMLRSRLGALRFLSRVSSRAVGHGDLLPLSIDRLAGSKGALLRAALEEASAPNSAVRMRLRAFSDWYLEHSQLGYALHRVTAELWDEVLAWAAASPRSDAEWFAQNAALIDSYLLGATLFRYRQVLGDTFRRIALLESLDAGSRGDEFPVDAILAVTRGKTNLAGGRGRAVRSLDDVEDRDAVARSNGWLLTALAQRIPYATAGFDWDHIFPHAQRVRMWMPGERGRRRHHTHRHLVNTSGNFWALPSSANRSLQATVGKAKFEILEEWMRSSDGVRVWPRDRWGITPEEVQRFIEVDEKLTSDPASINAAMTIFRDTVNGRSRRLLDEALERFPTIEAFGADAAAAKHDATPARHDYRDALGLSDHDPRLRTLTAGEAKIRLQERAQSIEPQVVAEVSAQALFEASRVWTYRGREKRAASHVVVGLAGGNSIELMFRWNAADGVRVEVKAYPDPERPNGAGRYTEFIDYPLGVPWAADDTDVVAAFVREVQRLQKTHPRG